MTRHFLVVGAQRSGTTWLHDRLAGHPGIAMARPATPEPKVFLSREPVDADDYRARFFGHAGPDALLGEKSTSYLESADRPRPGRRGAGRAADRGAAARPGRPGRLQLELQPRPRSRAAAAGRGAARQPRRPGAVGPGRLVGLPVRLPRARPLRRRRRPLARPVPGARAVPGGDARGAGPARRALRLAGCRPTTYDPAPTRPSTPARRRTTGSTRSCSCGCATTSPRATPPSRRCSAATFPGPTGWRRESTPRDRGLPAQRSSRPRFRRDSDMNPPDAGCHPNRDPPAGRPRRRADRATPIAHGRGRHGGLRTHAPGDCPVSSRNRRLKVRGLIFVCRASRCTVSLFIEVLQRPFPCRRRREVVRRRHLPIDVLRLAAVPVGRHHAVPGARVGDLRAMIGPHDVQAQVDSGGEAGRGQHVAVVDEQHVRVEQHLAGTAARMSSPTPMRRRGALVEQARGGEHERAGTDRHQPGVGPDPRRAQSDASGASTPAVRAVGYRVRRDHDRVGGLQGLGPAAGSTSSPPSPGSGPPACPHVTTS